MHCLYTLQRRNAEWPYPLTPKDRRETAIRQLERRLNIMVDRSDPMLRATAYCEFYLSTLGMSSAEVYVREASEQTAFIQAICQILEDESELIRKGNTGTGSFKKTVYTENGEQVTWHFPMATGWAATRTEWFYKEFFHMRVPAWIRRRPPCLFRRLCELALDFNRPLPPHNPRATSGAS